MKKEIIDGSRVAVIGSAGSFGSWSLQDINLWVAISVGLITGIFVTVKTLKLLYNWYWEHKVRIGALPPTTLLPNDPD